MLEFEDFHHLNEKESKKITENTKLTPKQSNGGDDIPFEIRFSNMVLNKNWYMCLDKSMTGGNTSISGIRVGVNYLL